MIGLRRTANVSARVIGSPGQARRVLTARPGPLGSMHQHPDHDSDHAQRSHDGEGDKATLERIHLRRPVPGRTAPARGAEGAEAAIVRICRVQPGITSELARPEIVPGRMNPGVSCADFRGAGI